MLQEPSWLGAAGHCWQLCGRVVSPHPSSPASCPGLIRLVARSPGGGIPIHSSIHPIHSIPPMAPRRAHRIPQHPPPLSRSTPALPESPVPPARSALTSAGMAGTAPGRGAEPRCLQLPARAAPARAEPLSGGGAGLQPAPGVGVGVGVLGGWGCSVGVWVRYLVHSGNRRVPPPRRCVLLQPWGLPRITVS